MKVRRLRNRVYRKKGGPYMLGLRCKEYFAGCLLCDSYRFFDENGRFGSYDEVRAAFPIGFSDAAEDESPVYFDRERMERAIAGPFFTIPPSLTRAERRQYITDCANGKIAPDPEGPRA